MPDLLPNSLPSSLDLGNFNCGACEECVCVISIDHGFISYFYSRNFVHFWFLKLILDANFLDVLLILYLFLWVYSMFNMLPNSFGLYACLGEIIALFRTLEKRKVNLQKGKNKKLCRLVDADSSSSLCRKVSWVHMLMLTRTFRI